MSLWWLIPALCTITSVAVLALLLDRMAVESEQLRRSSVKLVRVGVAVDGLRRQHRQLTDDLSRVNRQ